MGTVSLHGKIENQTTLPVEVGSMSGAADFSRVTALLAWMFDQVENTINGQIDSVNLSAGGVKTSAIADGAVTAAKLAVLSVTGAVVDPTVAQINTGQYTGDGTANRIIATGFRARFVFIVNHTTKGLFLALGGTASAFVRVQLDVSGNVTDGGTDFTGCSATGFTLGSAADGGSSNTNAVTYSYLALG